jgi:hypothetical protein
MAPSTPTLSIAATISSPVNFLCWGNVDTGSRIRGKSRFTAARLALRFQGLAALTRLRR